MGKTIVLTSVADGSFLGAETVTNVLVNFPADVSGDIPQNGRFEVVDMGKGRVALKATNGRFISVNTEETVVLKSLSGKPPGDSAGSPTAEPACLEHYSWRSRCHALFELPIAA